MNQRLSRTVIMILVGLLLAACGSGDASGPPDINYGRDICTECGMIISEARFAAAYTLADGTQKMFDDVGDLLIHQRQTGDSLDPEKTWVHDFETEEWVSVDVAYFVPTLSVATPMGHSILSFSDSDRANAFAADVGGEVIDWSTVMELPDVDGLIGDHHMDTEMDDTDTGSGETDQHDHDG